MIWYAFCKYYDLLNHSSAVSDRSKSVSNTLFIDKDSYEKNHFGKRKMIFLLLLIVIGLYCYFKLSLHKQRLMKYVGHLPSPKEYPIVGCGINFMGKNTERMSYCIAVSSLNFICAFHLCFYCRNYDRDIEDMWCDTSTYSNMVWSNACAVGRKGRRHPNDFKRWIMLKEVNGVSILAQGCGTVYGRT